MDDDKKDCAAKVMQILPERKKPVGLGPEAMARVMKAAQENPQPALRLRAHERKHPTAREYAEYRSGEPLSDEELHLHAHQLLTTAACWGGTKALRQFSEGAGQGTHPSRASRSPMPDWQTNKTGLPVSNPDLRATNQRLADDGPDADE